MRLSSSELKGMHDNNSETEACMGAMAMHLQTVMFLYLLALMFASLHETFTV